MKLRTSAWAAGILAVALLVVLAAAGAPYLLAEYILRHHDAIVAPPLGSRAVAGRWFDDYYLVETIEPDVYAIGEPRYYQGNYSYLIVGTERALLFDAGSGSRDLVPVVRSLTSLPVTVIPSHLQYDHVGALGRFDRTALLDDPELRSRTQEGVLELQRYEFLGFADGLANPRVKVDEWLPAGTTLDLGGRVLTFLSTPGHTPTSASLYDPVHRLLFCGDFMYPGPLYAFLPGASRGAYLKTARQLRRLLGEETLLLTAHAPDDQARLAAPRLGVADLQALIGTLDDIEAGSIAATGYFPRVFRVGDSMSFETGFAWNNR